MEDVHSNGAREGARSCGSLEAEGRAPGRREPLRDLFTRLGKEQKDDMPLFMLEEDHSEHRTECGLGAVKPVGIR